MPQHFHGHACIASASGAALIAVVMMSLASDVHAQTGTPAATTASTMAGNTQTDDASMLRDIAQVDLPETVTDQLAVEKASDPKVKEFAQQMVDDHTKALAEVTQLAQTKTVKLPTEPDAKHQAAMVKLKLMSGASFDKSCVKTAGVGDHVATEKLLKKTQSSARDTEVKALAARMLPVVQGHLAHARELDGMKIK